jgi:hypothetical protein
VSLPRCRQTRHNLRIAYCTNYRHSYVRQELVRTKHKSFRVKQSRTDDIEGKQQHSIQGSLRVHQLNLENNVHQERVRHRTVLLYRIYQNLLDGMTRKEIYRYTYEEAGDKRPQRNNRIKTFDQYDLLTLMVDSIAILASGPG